MIIYVRGRVKGALCWISVSCLIAVAFCGCAPSSHKPSSSIGVIESDGEEIRRMLADHTAIIASIRSEIRRLTGRVEELEYNLKNVKSATDELDKIILRLPVPAGVPEEELKRLIAELPSFSGVSEKMKDAVKAIMLEEYQKAVDVLNEVVEAVPEQDRIPEYLFWLGIALDKAGRFKEALAAFNECAAVYDTHRLAPPALYYQSLVFEKLGDKKGAVLTLKKLISKYPKSTYESLAKARLASISKGKKR